MDLRILNNMNDKRRSEFKRNTKLEELLQELNNILKYAEMDSVKNFIKPKLPVIFVVGCARSGTTLLMQWLTGTENFTFPTNFLSRFYKAPYIGLIIQKMLFDPQYNFRNELSGFEKNKNFVSSLGKTTGALSPNEFWYFWRRFFNIEGSFFDDEININGPGINKFRAEMAAMESVYKKPIIMKGMIMNWHLEYLEKILDNVLFIFLKREPLFNMQSIYESRIAFSGDEKNWYSFKPPEYTFLKKENPFVQIAGQVFYTNRSIKKQLKKINKSKWISLKYEDFCNNPVAVVNKIKEKTQYSGIKIPENSLKSIDFKTLNKKRLNGNILDRFEKAYKEISENENIE